MAIRFKVLLFLLITSSGYGQIADTLVHKKERSIKVLPVAYFMPETRIGVGALVYSVFKLNKSDSSSRYSNIQSYSSATQNKQFAMENEWQLFSKKEKFVFFGTLDYTRFPELFFGIGNNTNPANKELYSFDLIRLQSKNLKHLGKKLFAGIQYDMQYLFNVREKEGMMMNPEQVIGSNGYFTSTLGVLLLYDTRNYVLNTTSGTYGEVLFSAGNKLFFSGFNYNNITIDLRKYVTVFNHYTFAIHGYGNFNEGAVPFRVMPTIGGARYLRGYYKGRYRDNNLLVLQAETRVHLFWRMGIAAFTGIGQVAANVTLFNLTSFKYNYGAGIRYKLNKKENVNLRVDLGFNEEGYGLYVVFAEAF
jgi:hypothetical protein